MKTTAFLIFYGGVLITLDSGVVLASEAREGNRKGATEEVPSPPAPSFPLLTLPSFSSFSIPGLNFPILQAFSQPNRMSSPERAKETKTDYVEVTRRHTVHPVCYTAYEAKAPCLPYAQSDFQEDDYDGLEPESVQQAHETFYLNEVKGAQPSEDTSQEVNSRSGKYLEIKLRRNGGASQIEGSEFFPTPKRVPSQQSAPEYHTKTVLITKLEKYTDRRVTATLLAVNCLPVDRSIPMCQSYPSPIREAPDRRSDDAPHFQEGDFSPTQPVHEVLESDTSKISDLQIRHKTKPTIGPSVFEPEDVHTEDTLLGEE